MVLGACFGQFDIDRPRLDGDELPNLVLAVDHKAKRDGRDAPGANPLLHLGPQERAQPEADEPVDDAAGPLRVYQPYIDQSRRIERAAHSVRGAGVGLDTPW